MMLYRHGCTVFYLIVLMLAWPVGQLRAEDVDAYLKELNAEAEELVELKDVAPDASPAATDVSQNTEQAEARKQEFETALKTELSNTFNIYRNLTSQEKALVVEAYFAGDKKIGVASRQIFNFYFKVNNQN